MKNTSLRIVLALGVLALLLVLVGCGGGGGGETPADGDGNDTDQVDNDKDAESEADLTEDGDGEPDQAESETETEASDTLDGDEAESDVEPEAEIEKPEAESEPEAEAERDVEPEAENEPEIELSGPTPTVGTVIISEFMTDPSSSSRDYGQWLELTNTTGEAFSLYGCKLKNGLVDGNALGDILIPSHGRLLLGTSLLPSQTGGIQMQALWGGFTLSSHAGELRFICGTTEIDTVIYDNSWPYGMGQSLQLDNNQMNATANDLAANWCLSGKSYFMTDTGTPGDSNFVCAEMPDGDTDSDLESDTDGDLDEADGDLDEEDTDTEAEEEAPPAAPNPKAGEMVIDEIMFRSFGYNGTAPWFEAKVLATTDVSLDGCGIEIGGSSVPLSAGPNLTSGRYVLFAEEISSSYGFALDFSWANAVFDPDGGALRLICGATVVDELSYTPSWIPTDAGRTLSLSPAKTNAADNDDLASWCPSPAAFAFYFGNYGSPGGANEACPVVVIDGDQDSESEEEPIEDGDSDSETPLSSTPQPGDMVISEFMVYPNVLTLANGQWFELVNMSGQTLDLKGCVFGNGYNWGQTTIADSLTVPSGGRIVIGHNADAAANGGVLVSYAWSGWEFGTTADTIRLNCDGVSIDQIGYDSSWPLGQGQSVSVSLAYQTAADNDYPEGWCASTSIYDSTDNNMGTPGAANDECGGPVKRR